MGEFLVYNPDNEKELQKYEDISKIQAREITEPTPDKRVISIDADENESSENVRQKLEKELKDHNWWLQDYWKEKGLPKEQFSIQIENDNIDVFNFSEPLSQRHLDELKEAVEVFTHVKGENILAKVKYILLDNLSKANSRGGNLNGAAPHGEEAIKIYPEGLKFTPHRIPQASNFQGTVIHELSHLLSTNDWANTFKWDLRDTNDPNKNQYTETPERCITNYAQFSPNEDLCESMVAAIKVPETLDPERLAFIKERILEEPLEKTNDSVTITKKKEVELPKIKQPVLFKRKRIEINFK